MMRQLVLPALIGAALVLGATPAVVAAQERTAGQEAPSQGAGAQTPLPRVLSMLAKRYKGKQINTTMGQSAGRAVYLVQWQFPSGQIVTFTVDAQTGQVLGQ